MPRTWEGAPNGYMDLDEDDFDTMNHPWMSNMQEDVLKPVSWIQSVVSTSLSHVYHAFLIRAQQGTGENVY